MVISTPGNVKAVMVGTLMMDWATRVSHLPVTDELAFTRWLDPSDRTSAARRDTAALSLVVQPMRSGDCPMRVVERPSRRAPPSEWYGLLGEAPTRD